MFTQRFQTFHNWWLDWEKVNCEKSGSSSQVVFPADSLVDFHPRLLVNAQRQQRDKKHHLPNHCPGLPSEILGPRQSLIVAKTGQRVAMQRARSAKNFTHDSD
jgi:hypothetical protein